MRRIIFAAALAMLPLLVVSAAHAEGTSIATAQAVAFGQQEFGNTINGRLWENTNCEEGKRKENESYWALSLVVGDELTIDWEAQQPQTKLELFPIGTTDFNLGKTAPLVQQGLSSNNKNELKYTDSTVGGAMPLIIHNASCEGTNGPGPYSFVVYVLHAVRVYLPRLSTLRPSGAMTVSVRNPEGGNPPGSPLAVELQLAGGSGWRTIGSGTTSGTSAVVHFKVPSALRHRRATLRALVHGHEYQPATSAHLKVRTL
jgi:hypothetical protein